MGQAPPWWHKLELAQFPWLAQVVVCRLLLRDRVQGLGLRPLVLHQMALVCPGQDLIWPWASGPQPQDVVPRKQDSLADSGRLDLGQHEVLQLPSEGATFQRVSRATVAAGHDGVSCACCGICWGSAILRCQGRSCYRATAMLRGEGCCSPRGAKALEPSVGSGPIQRGVGPHPGFVAWSAGVGRVGTFDSFRTVWRRAGHHSDFGACGGCELATRCCSSRGWGPIIFGVLFACFGAGRVHPRLAGLGKWPSASRKQSPSVGDTPMEGLEDQSQSAVEVVAMEVDGGVVEPLLGAYADLLFSPLSLEEDLLVLLGDKPTATEQNFSSSAGDWAGGPALSADFSWWEVSAFCACDVNTDSRVFFHHVVQSWGHMPYNMIATILVNQYQYYIYYKQAIWTTRTQDNSHPGKLLTKRTHTQVNSYPGELVPRAIRTQVNSYPSHLVPGTWTQDYS